MDNMKYEPVEHNHGELIEKAMERPGFKDAYEERKEVYALIREMLVARENAGLTQEESAKKNLYRHRMNIALHCKQGG